MERDYQNVAQLMDQYLLQTRKSLSSPDLDAGAIEALVRQLEPLAGIAARLPESMQDNYQGTLALARSLYDQALGRGLHL